MESINFDELPNTLEKKGNISLPHELQVIANSYKTRAIIDLVINGKQEAWHSLKGGILEQNKVDYKKLKGITYLVLYNPESNLWLKMVPPETVQKSTEGLALRLKRSVPAAKKALRIAGLPDIAEQLMNCKIIITGKTVDGFISPHIGPSVDYYLKKLLPKGEQIDVNAKDFLSEVYRIAFNQALRLYLNHNVWVDDPNPGNILMHFDQNNIRVVLIDFANNKQTARTTFEKTFPERRSEQLLKKMQQLYESFRVQSTRHGLEFIECPDHYFNDIVSKQFPNSI